MSTASEMLELYIAAEKAVLRGQAFELNGRSLTRAALADIQRERAMWERRVQAETVAAAGGAPGVAIADFSGEGSCGSFRRAC